MTKRPPVELGRDAASNSDLDPPTYAAPTSALQVLLRIPTDSLLACLDELSLQIGDDKIRFRTGGSMLLAVFGPGDATPSELTVSFGKPQPDRLGGATFHVGKKFYALRKCHTSGGKEICSGQCANTSHRNTDDNTYPGCICFVFPDGTHVYIGISGWKAEVDESGAYYIAKHLGFPLPPNYKDVVDPETTAVWELGDLVFETNFEGVRPPIADDGVPPFDAGFEEWQIGLMHAAAETL